MQRVLVFGTFDVLHEGHEHFFRTARAHGDALTVVVARDETVARIKGRPPLFTERMRVRELMRTTEVDRVVLGSLDDRLEAVRAERPHVVCLGYDQTNFVDELEREQIHNGHSFEIVRLDAHKPEQHKSSRYKTNFIGGVVGPGRGEGTALGYPTANIDPARRDQHRPDPGVYAATFWCDDAVYPAVAVIGARHENDLPLVEAHVLDFSGDLYGHYVVLALEYWLRDIESFTDPEALTARIREDIDYVYRNHPRRWDRYQFGTRRTDR